MTPSRILAEVLFTGGGYAAAIAIGCYMPHAAPLIAPLLVVTAIVRMLLIMEDRRDY